MVTPGTNTRYWIKLKDYLANPLAAYPVGSYYMSSNSPSPAKLFGGTWPQIQNRFIFAAGPGYSVNSTGGSATKTLVTDNIPSHSHSCGSAGSHTHTRGTMNITGSAPTDVAPNSGYSGAMYNGGAITATSANGEDNKAFKINFDASRNWTGETSSNGNHTHTIGSTGKGTAFDVMPPYIVAYVWRRTA